MRVQFRIILLSLLSVFLLNACSAPSSQEPRQERMVKLVYTDWSEAVALTTLAQILLEDRMDFDVQTKLSDVESAYAEVARGEADVFADAWLPETHGHYLEAYADSIEQLGIIYPDARTGLLVPAYSRYHSLEDLKGTDVTIIGIEAEAGVMYQARYAMQQYMLETVQLKNLSEQEMVRLFTEAYKRREEVIITGWEPHGLFARFDIRFLDDPLKVFGEKENIYALGTRGLEDRLPDVVRFFERMQLSEKQINSLIDAMTGEASPEDGVREWISKHDYIINQWVKNLKPDRKKIM
ncbi:glycine betaine ABC transporter substrate-binding protein [uncultured Sunxiuqinia sp.]|uniref:glycine betaine ABC transporter substrate-binding protein n=1 Tax=uncultured Sunxiuqinia sp. TaxID=1573825 RepID=UPI0026299986|nr:glycine betaine ABC transporter substrate-binding protein [uncultured Sunxiuqinia sp.]